MKKRILSFLLMTALLCALLPASAAAAETVTINVYNWGQYIADGTDGYLDVIEEFEKEYPHIKVNYMTYDSNESMYTKLKSGGSTFDIIIPSDYMVEKLIEEDMLLPLHLENIDNFQYIDEAFKDPTYDPGNVYSVPYTWGSVGIIYNTRYVNEDDIGSWDLLWNPTYAGKILMFDNPRDAFAIAQLSLGQSINSEDPAELQAAADLLRQQKPLVQAYVMDQVYDKMQRAEAWIAPYYAGDYLLMVEENPDLAFYFPEEGYNLFVDAICIPKSSTHQAEAETFINFLLRPDICGQNLEYLGYSSPSTASKEYMDPEVAEDPIAYPDEETLALGSSFNSLSLEGTQLMNELWLTVKTADSSTTLFLILTVVAVISVGFLWIFFKVRKRRQRACRCRKWREQ